MRKVISFIAIVFLLFIYCNRVAAQLAGPSVFLQGHWLEAGINNVGGLGAGPVPADCHPYPAGLGALASVYDYGHDGWTVGTPAFYGDYTFPGSTFEGWEIQVNGVRNQAFTTGTSSVITGPGTLTGGLTGSYDTGGTVRCMWTGTAVSGAFSVSMETKIDTNASWIVMTVKFLNTGTITMNNIYYMRSCDPDGDEAHGGSFATNNTIVHQNEDATHKVEVDAEGNLYNDHLSLCTKDNRARAFIYEAWPMSISTDLASVYSEALSGAQYTLGGTLDGDYAMGIVYNLGNIAPGDSTIISYAYVYNGIDGIDSAFVTSCGGMPISGAVTTTTSLACPTTLVLLSDTGSTTGASYLWQSSPDSSTWTNIAGATNTTYSFTGLSANTYYRCMVSCTLDSTVFAPTAGILETYTTTCPCLLYNAGTVVTNAPYACTADTVWLTDTTYSAPAASLQWQSSADSASWTNIPGAITSSYSFTDCTTTMWYRLVLSCPTDSMVSAGTKVTYSALCVCTGTPDGGAATASITYCSACFLALGITGSSAADSLGYQWQSSSDSVTWTNIPGATTVPYTLSPTGAAYYRCIVTCDLTGLNGYSAGIFVGYDYLISDYSVSTTVDTTCTPPDFYIQVNGISPLLEVITYYGDGTYDSSALTAAGATSSANMMHDYASPGAYTIKQVLYYNGIPQDSVTYSYTYSYCSTLAIRFYMDENSDCAKEYTEPYNGIPLLVAVDSNGVRIDTLSATSGLYYMSYGGPGTVYGFSVVSSYLAPSCPALTEVYDTITTTVGGYTPTYYGLTCLGTGFDLSVYDVIPVTGQHDQWGNVYVANSYCTPVNATVTLHYSPIYNVDYYLSWLSPAATSYTDSTITWNVTGLSSTSGVSDLWYAIRTGLPGDAPLAVGDIATTYVEITPTTGDLDTSNNHCTVVDTVKAGCDPNEMSVSPATCIQPDSVTKLQYTISFVNTGNDTAHNIYVMDTLSNNVDANSLRVLMASATMNIEVFNDGVHNIAKFDFPQINLLDSTFNSAACSGAVIFTINTLPGLAAGASVQNHAGIFFDINPVVMTNTVANKVGCTDLGVAAIHNSNTSIYPNPTHESLTIISSGNISNIIITNILGQNVFSSDYSASQVQVNVAALPAGVYFVKINGNEVRKFVKE